MFLFFLKDFLVFVSIVSIVNSSGASSGAPSVSGWPFVSTEFLCSHCAKQGGSRGQYKMFSDMFRNRNKNDVFLHKHTEPLYHYAAGHGDRTLTRQERATLDHWGARSWLV